VVWIQESKYHIKRKGKSTKREDIRKELKETEVTINVSLRLSDIPPKICITSARIMEKEACGGVLMNEIRG
jgi:hypothetical protein